MDLSAYISFLVQADITNINAPVLTLTDNSAYPGGVVPTGIFTIKQPDGVIRTGSFTSPDISGGVLVATIALRLNSQRKVQCGEYVITYQVDADTYVPTTLVRAFTINYTGPSIILEQDFDVFTPSLSYKDVTNYVLSGFTQTVTRAWNAVIASVGTITGTNAAIFDLKYSGAYYDAAYVVNFSASAVYQSTVYSFLSIKDSYVKQIGTDAYTPPTSAQLLGYLTTLKARLDLLINSCQKYDKAKADYEYAYTLYAHANKRICAHDSVGVQTYILEILNILNNSVGISQAHTNAVMSVYIPDCGSGGGGSSSELIAEVWAGTAEAIAAGIIVGSFTFVNSNLIGANVSVNRGGSPLPGIVPLDGRSYYTHVTGSNTITFSDQIQDEEYFKINT